MTITYIAFANGSNNALGPADAAITVFRKDVEGGQVMDEQQIAYWVGTEIDDEDGDLDTAAAEKQLDNLGWRITGAGWVRSGDGQEAIEVEPWDDGRPVSGF